MVHPKFPECVGVFRNVNAPSRLEVIVEGESLINDGVAITLYTVTIGLATAGTVDVSGALGLFARQVIGGVLVGAVLGVVFSRLTAIVDDHMIEMTLSSALAYGSYLAAQSLDMSGALACVAAGLIHGSYGREVGMAERTRRLLDDLWEYFGFVVNALVFLLVGFTADLASLVAAAGQVLVSIAVVFASRVIVVSGAPLLLIVFRRRVRNSVPCPHSCSSANHWRNAIASASWPAVHDTRPARDASHTPAVVIAAPAANAASPARFEGRRCSSSDGRGGSTRSRYGRPA